VPEDWQVPPGITAPLRHLRPRASANPRRSPSWGEHLLGERVVRTGRRSYPQVSGCGLLRNAANASAGRRRARTRTSDAAEPSSKIPVLAWILGTIVAGRSIIRSLIGVAEDDRIRLSFQASFSVRHRFLHEDVLAGVKRLLTAPQKGGAGVSTVLRDRTPGRRATFRWLGGGIVAEASRVSAPRLATLTSAPRLSKELAGAGDANVRTREQLRLHPRWSSMPAVLRPRTDGVTGERRDMSRRARRVASEARAPRSALESAWGTDSLRVPAVTTRRPCPRRSARRLRSERTSRERNGPLRN
jgi:hypothetical protein